FPTVCANIYTATDLCPASSSRLQRRQCRFPKGLFLAASSRPKKNIVSTPLVQVGRKIPVVDGLASRTPCRKPQINSRARTELRRDNLPPEPDCALVRRGPHHALCGDERWRFATNHQPITGSDCSGAH